MEGVRNRKPLPWMTLLPLFVTIVLSDRPSTSIQVYTQKIEMHGRYINEATAWTKSEPHIKDCAESCSQDTRCVSFFYNPNTEECSAKFMEFLPSDSSSVQPDINYVVQIAASRPRCKGLPAANQSATFTVTSADVGQTAAYVCDGEYVDTGSGNVTCLESGTWSEASCKAPCNPGSFRNPTGDCAECPAGQYQNQEEQSSCISCGSYMTSLTPRNSTASCIAACFTGRYSDTGYEPCEPCPLKYYQDVRAQTQCTECPLHHTTDHVGSQSASDCKFEYVSSSIRLASSVTAGRIEVFHDGVWGTVCDDSFNDESALLACRMLGYSGAVRYYTDGSGSGTIWLDNVSCTGTETTLAECTSLAWGENNCGHDEDVGVECN